VLWCCFFVTVIVISRCHKSKLFLLTIAYIWVSGFFISLIFLKHVVWHFKPQVHLHVIKW